MCADLADFRRMAVDEDMAISFYKAGDPGDLADKLIAILRSPEQQRQLAHHNFSAAMRMTMPSVVRHYLRWFELSRHRQTMSGFVKFPLLQSRRRLRNAASIRTGLRGAGLCIPRRWRMAKRRRIRRKARQSPVTMTSRTHLIPT